MSQTSQEVEVEVDDHMLKEIENEEKDPPKKIKSVRINRFDDNKLKNLLKNVNTNSHQNLSTYKVNKTSISILSSKITDIYESINKHFSEIKPKQYELGMYLHYTKQYCKMHTKSFYDFINKKTPITSRSQINFYINFYFFIKKFPQLLNVELSASFIMENKNHILSVLQEINQ